MLFDLQWIETKGPEWKVASVRDINNIEYHDASINRTDRKTGAVFPKFDELTAGMKIEADLWTSPAGKHYLFAPKPQHQGGPRSGGGAPRAAAITAAQDHKAEHIKNAQENKERSIMVASAMRDATILLEYAFGEEIQQLPPNERMAAIKAHHKEVRDWYLKTWSEVEKQVDVPFV
jgi:hypothetical protein